MGYYYFDIFVRMEFDDRFIQRKMNKFGGYYYNGKPLDPEKRKEIIRQLNDGIRVTQIGRNLQVSHGVVSKIVKNYRKTQSIEPKQRKPYARKNSSSTEKNELGFSFDENLIENLPQKRRNNFTVEQTATLLEYFDISPLPDLKMRDEISKKTSLTDKQILIWFNNKRSRTRKSLIDSVASISESSSVASVNSSSQSSSYENSVLQPSPLSSPLNFQLPSIPLPSLPISPMISLPQFPLLPSPLLSNFTTMLQMQQYLTAQYYLTSLLQQMQQK